jgi:hypothetical protein
MSIIKDIGRLVFCRMGSGSSLLSAKKAHQPSYPFLRVDAMASVFFRYIIFSNEIFR